MNKIIPIIIAALTLAVGAKAQTKVTIFDSGNDTKPYYRIPAILNQNGTLWAFTDDRSDISNTSCWGDIGCGKISIIAKTSTDNGATWSSSTKTVAAGSSSSSGFAKAHGDAAVVCDREDPNKMLVMCASGETSYRNSTVTSDRSGWSYTLNLDNAIRVGKYTSTNGGQSWSGSDVTEDIYGIWDTKKTWGGYNTTIQKLFFSSGRICQSAIIKKEDYYRLYAALCTNEGSLVVYSDDFGGTWSALGGTAVSGGNEAKIEELPNGNVLISSRMTGGRHFNIFTYTDQSLASGSWGSHVSSTSDDTNGIISRQTDTNGEILLVPAMANNSNVPIYIALQSVPYGPDSNLGSNTKNRCNVSIYWKVLSSPSDLDEPSDFENGWTRYEVSSTTSAYSSMVLDNNGDIAFIYEENAINTIIGGTGNMDYYDIQFKSLPLSTITNGAYTYTTAKDVATHRTAFLNNTNIDDSGETTDPWVGKIITLKSTVKKINGGTIEYYLHNEGVNLKLEETKPTLSDYSYYWVISKDPGEDTYYLSSLKGDGYMGKGKGWDYYQNKESNNIPNCTDDYTKQFNIKEFTHYGNTNNRDGAETITGYAIGFIHAEDENKTKYVAIAEDGQLGWFDLTTMGGTSTSDKTKYWSTNFEIKEVNKTETVKDYGTWDAPTHFGFPVKMTRSDNGKGDTRYEGYYYYATLKLPFAVDLKSAKDESGKLYDVEVLECTTPQDQPGEEVKLTDITKDLTDNTLPRETPVILRMGQKDTPIDNGREQITLYFQPALAQNIITSTGLKGSLGSKTFQGTDASAADYYDPSKNANFFILGKKADGRVKFYYLSNKVLAANKAYYVYNGTASSKSIVFRFADDDISTGITLPEVIEANDNAVIYDLSGRRVSSAVKKGIYIRDGKKFIVK